MHKIKGGREHHTNIFKLIVTMTMFIKTAISMTVLFTNLYNLDMKTDRF